jgi:hypothetical protein
MVDKTVTGTAGSSLPAAGGTSMAGLSDWASPYITDYLGKAQGLANKDYQVYQGPLTADPSVLQSKVFQGLGNLAFPSNLGQSFTNAGAPTIGAGGQPGGANLTMSGNPPQGSTQPGNIAQQYMNPYLQSVLDPQLAELRRQNDITNMNANAKLTQAGAFGGGRQAIMNAENNRNLMMEQNKTVGQGYANAYDKAMGQFNTEQQQGRDLTKMMTDIGGIQRGITSEGIAADLGEFNTQREFPYKQVQFQRDMISGLPTGSVSNSPTQLSGIAQLISSAGGIDSLLKASGQKDLGGLLKTLGLNFGGTEEPV